MDRPNVLWICTDQQRFDTIRAINNPHIRTPNLDRLVSEGTAFTHAFSQSPVCTPSRAAFLTGRYPRTCRGRQNGQAVFPDDELLVPRLMADAGYDCGLAGKLHLAVCHKHVEPRTNDGYRVFHWSHHPQPDWAENAYIQWLAAQGKTWDELYHRPPGEHVYPGVPAQYHQTTWCAEKAMEFMREQRNGPWLMSVNPFDPHHPFDPPAEYMERHDPGKVPAPRVREGEWAEKPKFQQVDHEGSYGGRGFSCAAAAPEKLQEIVAAYYAMIELIDDQVGRLLAALEQTGQRENTIVIFHSDHGEMLGDHGIMMKGPYFYECAVRVPLIVSWPGRFRQGLQSDALVELIDLAPTILEACGLPIPDRMHARSLVPILTGQADPAEHRDHVYCEYYNAMPGHDHSAYGTMYRDRHYKICVYHGSARGEGELYDLENDPNEFQNLWNSPQHQELKMNLVLQCFDGSVFTADPWPQRVGLF